MFPAPGSVVVDRCQRVRQEQPYSTPSASSIDLSARYSHGNSTLNRLHGPRESAGNSQAGTWMFPNIARRTPDGSVSIEEGKA